LFCAYSRDKKQAKAYLSVQQEGHRVHLRERRALGQGVSLFEGSSEILPLELPRLLPGLEIPLELCQAVFARFQGLPTEGMSNITWH
jgi:hypothetical protein